MHSGEAKAPAPIESKDWGDRFWELPDKDATPEERLQMIAKYKTPQGNEELATECLRYFEKVATQKLKKSSDFDHLDDMVTTAAEKAVRNIDQFRGESRFLTWLHQIMINEIIMYFRKAETQHQKVTGSVDELIEEGLDPVSHDPSADAKVMDREKKEYLIKAINRLPKSQREVIKLHYLEELSISEVAQKLGLTDGSIKAHLFRGKENLEKILETQGFQPE